jgi:hypothetical protein
VSVRSACTQPTRPRTRTRRYPVRPSNVLVWVAAASSPDALDQAAGQVAIARQELANYASANGYAEILLDVLRLEPTHRSCLNGTDTCDSPLA